VIARLALRHFRNELRNMRPISKCSKPDLRRAGYCASVHSCSKSRVRLPSITKNRIQFVIGRPAIRSKQVTIVTMGANGPPGGAEGARTAGFPIAKDQHSAATSAKAKKACRC